MPRSIRPLIALCGSVLLLLPASAQAQAPPPTEIDGKPLNVWASGDGGIQVNVDGYPASEWYRSTVFDPEKNDNVPNPEGNAGYGVIFDPANPSSGAPRFGKLVSGTQALESGPTLTPGSPATITTSWIVTDSSNAPYARITQLVSYTDGSRQFDTTLTIENMSAAPITFRTTVAGDLSIRGSDVGIGFLTGSPPTRFMGGLNQEVGAAGGFVEQTAWTRFESNTLGNVTNALFDSSEAGGFDNTLSTEPADNAAGAQWDDHYSAPIQPGQSASYQVGWKFIDTLGLTPPTDKHLTGETATLTASVGDLNGNNAGDRTIDYKVAGSNNLSGKLKTGSDGKAKISYVGGVPGTDVVTAFIDQNGNGTRDENEAQATATIEWDGPPAPEIGETAGVRPVGKGTVKIKLPPGTSLGKAKRLGLTGAASGFVKLTEAKQIPMGSTLDTTKGTVNLLSDASKSSTAGKFQSGNFNGGQFLLTQTKKNPLTQLSMRGGGLGECSTRVPKGGSAARKRKRHLFSSVKGRFRTRGRNSSATVRGTKWTMTDTCAGTLTSVKSGSVVVHDFTLRKNKTVKAGHRYFARAPKLRRVRK